jgi:hypothetical protein
MMIGLSAVTLHICNDINTKGSRDILDIEIQN